MLLNSIIHQISSLFDFSDYRFGELKNAAVANLTMRRNGTRHFELRATPHAARRRRVADAVFWLIMERFALCPL